MASLNGGERGVEIEERGQRGGDYSHFIFCTCLGVEPAFYCYFRSTKDKESALYSAEGDVIESTAPCNSLVSRLAN